MIEISQYLFYKIVKLINYTKYNQNNKIIVINKNSYAFNTFAFDSSSKSS